MNEHVDSVFEQLLAPGALTTIFEPIVEVRPEGRRLYGFECLTRGPKGTNLEHAGVLFEYVRRKRKESIFDRTCVATALQAARALPGTQRLGINVHASTLGRDRGFIEFLVEQAHLFAIDRRRLTVEIVEHLPPWNLSRFERVLEDLHALGLRVALDDVGLGLSNYKMILDCQPDYFKVDRYVVAGSHADVHRQAVLSSIVGLASSFGAGVVAEGIEDVADLDCVTGLGINLIQGYLFTRAEPGSKFDWRGLPDAVRAERGGLRLRAASGVAASKKPK